MMNAYALRELAAPTDELQLRPGSLRVVQLLHSGYDSERYQIKCFEPYANGPFPPLDHNTSLPFACEQPDQHELQRFGITAAFVRLPGDNLTALTSENVYGPRAHRHGPRKR